jgi:phosphoglucomutase
MNISPLAGHPAPAELLLDVPALLAAYYHEIPDAAVRLERVSFGTSGHRGSAFDRTFNEHHVLAISEAICRYRRTHSIEGPLFLGIDTHALSAPACATALEVLAAHGVNVMLAEHDEYTPTPAVSHAIVCYNRGLTTGLADGIVMTPSHNPPADGGFKYNPPNGGGADTAVTSWIEASANELLEQQLAGVQRIPHEKALRAATTHRHDYLNSYVDDLANVVDLDSVRNAGLRIGVDPLGGAGIHYWPRIAERYRLDLTIVNDAVDPTFGFMSVDWDGRIRMDPSSRYAMQRLIGFRNDFDISVACDTDHDRHGIVCRSSGLMPSNDYLAVSIHHLFRNRPEWRRELAIGKTVVSSALIDRVSRKLSRRLYEVPVGFKWFADGLAKGELGFCGEESAGATFLRRSGETWTTDKDGIIAGLLAAEITACAGRDPGDVYHKITSELGTPANGRVEAHATPAQKKILGALSPEQVKGDTLAGERIQSIITRAPGNGAPIGGVKVAAETGWFAARPSGTEDIYKIYGESFRGSDQLDRILVEAQAIVDAALAVGEHHHAGSSR